MTIQKRPINIKSFTDLETWEEAHTLVLAVYKLTKKFPREEQFGLTTQLRRAAVSVTSNIAEGFCKIFPKEKIQFYTTALASLAEIQNQLLIARDVSYLTNEEFCSIAPQTTSTGKLLNALISVTRKRIIQNPHQKQI